jgi:hypothetical protein
MDQNGLDALLITLGSFGGGALIIWTSLQGKVARIKAEAQARQMTASPLPDGSVIAELKAIRQQIAEMQSTGHQFDISFDAALERLEGRVNRLETKSAVSTAAATEAVQTLRNGFTP